MDCRFRRSRAVSTVAISLPNATATLALPLGFFCRLGDGSRCRRFTASLSSLHERTVRPSRPAYPRHTQPNIQLSVRPRKMPPRPRGLNADVAHAACKYSAVYLRWCSLCCLVRWHAMRFSLYYADCQSASTSFIVPDVIRYSPFVIPAFNAVFRQLSRMVAGCFVFGLAV